MIAHLLEKLEEIGDSIITDLQQLEEFGRKWRAGVYQYSIRNVLLASNCFILENGYLEASYKISLIPAISPLK